MSEPMQIAGKIDVRPLFAEARGRLIDLLSSLDARQWESPTICEGWSVRDIAAHIVADDLGVVSARRDGYTASRFEGSWDKLIAYINRQNEAWVAAMRRLSPSVVMELLRFSGAELVALFRSADLDTVGPPVSWAGPQAAPYWLDIAREYTERWLHQQQIRDAVGAPALQTRRLFAPVLDTFVRALPHTFRTTPAPDGTNVGLTITGSAGAAWALSRESGSWLLYRGHAAAAAAHVEIDQDLAWRLFSKGVMPAAALPQVSISGDRRLATKILDTVSIIA